MKFSSEKSVTEQFEECVFSFLLRIFFSCAFVYEFVLFVFPFVFVFLSSWLLLKGKPFVWEECHWAIWGLQKSSGESWWYNQFKYFFIIIIKITIITIIIIIAIIIIIIGTFFPVIRVKRCFDVRKKEDQVARIGGGFSLIWAMPES